MTREPIETVSRKQVENWKKGYEQEPQSRSSLIIRMTIAVIVIVIMVVIAIAVSLYIAASATLLMASGADEGSGPWMLGFGIFILVICLGVSGLIVFLLSSATLDWARRITSVTYFG